MEIKSGKPKRKRYQITRSQDIFSGDPSPVSPVWKGVNVNEERNRVSKTFTFANVKVLAFSFIADKLVPREVIILFLFRVYQHFKKLSQSYQVYEQHSY